MLQELGIKGFFIFFSRILYYRPFNMNYFCISPAPPPCVLACSYPTRRAKILVSLRSPRTRDKIRSP